MTAYINELSLLLPLFTAFIAFAGFVGVIGVVFGFVLKMIQNPLEKDIAELKTGQTELKAEFKADIKELKAEFKADIKELKTELKDLILAKK